MPSSSAIASRSKLSLMSARMGLGGTGDGVAFFTYAVERGRLLGNYYEGYVLSRWMGVYNRLCEGGRYSLACLFWGFKKIVKKRLPRYELIDEEE